MPFMNDGDDESRYSGCDEDSDAANGGCDDGQAICWGFQIPQENIRYYAVPYTLMICAVIFWTPFLWEDFPRDSLKHWDS